MRQSDRTAVNTKLSAALQKYYGKKKTIVLAGKTYNIVDLVTAFSTENAAIASAVTTKAASREAAAEVEAQQQANNPLRAAIHQTVLVAFANDPAVLNDFGYSAPRRRARMTGQAMVATAQKAQATRNARGTLGSRARKEIHGVTTTNGASTASPSNGTSNGTAGK